MALVNLYIHFNGNAEEAFNFTKLYLAGRFAKKMRYKDLPETSFSIVEPDAGRIMHIAPPHRETEHATRQRQRCRPWDR